MLNVKSMDCGVRDREMNGSKRKRENERNGIVSVSLSSSHYEMRTCTPLGKLLCLGSLMYSFLVRLKNFSLRSPPPFALTFYFYLFIGHHSKGKWVLNGAHHSQGSWYLKAAIYCAVTAFSHAPQPQSTKKVCHQKSKWSAAICHRAAETREQEIKVSSNLIYPKSSTNYREGTV